MKSNSQDSLEIEVRELLEPDDFDQVALNDLLRENEQARPIVAKVLAEEAALIGSLRVEGAKEWADSLERKLDEEPDFQLLAAAGKRGAIPISKRSVGMFLATSCCAVFLIGALALTFWKEKPSDTPVATNEEKVIVLGGIGSVTSTNSNSGFYSTGDRVEEGELSIGDQRLRIDLDNGIALSLTGPARMRIGSDRAHVFEGQLHIDSPEHISAYIVDTEFARFVDLGTVFSVSATAGESIALSVTEGLVHAKLFSPDKGVTSQDMVSAGQGVFATNDSLEFESVAPETLGHNDKLPLAESPFSPLDAERYRERVLASKPIVLWGFDDTSTPLTVANKVSSDFIAKMSGDVVIKGSGPKGNYAVFGSNGRAGSITSSQLWKRQTLEPFTVEMWSRPDRVHWGHLINFGTGEGIDPIAQKKIQYQRLTHFAMEWTDQVSQFPQAPPHQPMIRTIFRAPLTYSSDLTVPGGVNLNTFSPYSYVPGRWYHRVARWDGKEFVTYVDGIRVMRERVQISRSYDVQLDIRVGWLDEKVRRPLIGAVDEVAIYDRALSDEEIREHYEAAGKDR